MKRLALAAILIATVVGGCDLFAPTSPRSFALETLGGMPLPASGFSRGGPAIFGDTIVVTGQSTPGFLVHVSYRTWYAGNSGPQLSATSEDFEPRGDSLVYITPACPPNADCVFAPHTMRFDGDRVAITYSDTAFRVRSFREIK